MASQLKQLQKMGSLSSLMGMLPGLPQMQKKMKDAKLDDGVVKRQLAIISSMTPKERARPELLKASRKRRVAGGSGSSVQEVNKLLKQYQEAGRVMKKMSKLGKKGLARHGLGGILPSGGGFPR